MVLLAGGINDIPTIWMDGGYSARLQRWLGNYTTLVQQVGGGWGCRRWAGSGDLLVAVGSLAAHPPPSPDRSLAAALRCLRVCFADAAAVSRRHLCAVSEAGARGALQ